MTRKTRILGLNDYRLTAPGLIRLGEQRVRFSVQLIGLKLESLVRHQPRQRNLKLRAALKKQFKQLANRFPEAHLISRDQRRGSWTLDGELPARRVSALASQSEVQELTILSIDGRRRTLVRPTLGWFCVWGVVAIQIEECTRGNVSVEDRFILVKAYDATDACRRLRQEWSSYARPYLNPDGYLVRWQLASVQDVYAVMQAELDPRGTEVYSRLRTERMKPEYRWHRKRKASNTGM